MSENCSNLNTFSLDENPVNLTLMGDIRYNRLLTEGVELTDDELEELVHYSVILFEVCQEQLPDTLFKRLVEHDMDMNWYFDELIAVASNFKKLSTH